MAAWCHRDAKLTLGFSLQCVRTAAVDLCWEDAAVRKYVNSMSKATTTVMNSYRMSVCLFNAINEMHLKRYH